MAKEKKAKRKKIVSLQAKKQRFGWVFVAPFVIGFLFYYLPVIFESVAYSFMSVRTNPQAQTFSIEYVGLTNFKDVLTGSSSFVGDLRNTIVSMLYTLPILILFSLFIAIILNAKMKGRAFFRAMFFIPVIISTGIIAKADAANTMSAVVEVSKMAESASVSSAGSEFTNNGLIFYLTEMFEQLHLESLIVFVKTAAEDVYGVINNSGVQILIFLAGLQSISPALYEAASIEGCSQWESFWKITIPMISPMILTNIIYTIVDHFTKYDNKVMNYVSDLQKSANYGNAAAASWIYFLVILAIIGIIAGCASKLVFYRSKNE